MARYDVVIPEGLILDHVVDIVRLEGELLPHDHLEERHQHLDQRKSGSQVSEDVYSSLQQLSDSLSVFIIPRNQGVNDKEHIELGSDNKVAKHEASALCSDRNSDQRSGVHLPVHPVDDLFRDVLAQRHAAEGELLVGCVICMHADVVLHFAYRVGEKSPKQGEGIL